MRWSWRWQARKVEPRPVVSRAQELETAKKILNDVNVAVIPGDGFGAEGWIRLTFSTSQERIREGIGRIKSWIA